MKTETKQKLRTVRIKFCEINDKESTLSRSVIILAVWEPWPLREVAVVKVDKSECLKTSTGT